MQYIIPLDDSDGLIESITLLYIKSNYALPSMSAPYSVAELDKMIDQIDYNKLDESGKNIYQKVSEKLQSYYKDSTNDVTFNFKTDINLETYYHSNTVDNLGRETWIRGWREQKSLIDLKLNIYSGSFMYATSEFSLGPARVNLVPFGSNSFTTNILGTTGLDIGQDTDSNMPYRAFVSLGGPLWNLQIGRDNIDWGAGISGNMFVSDNLKYQDYIKFTTFGNSFKYSYLASFFPHQLNYIKTDGYSLNTSQLHPLVGFSMFSAHKFEGRLFNNKLGWAISEGLMYASEDSTLDFRAFNPMFLYHNMFTKANSNSIISFDFDFTFSSSTNLYSQIVIDDLIVPFTEGTPPFSPNAVGIILGVRSDLSSESVSIISSFEVAYTTPYLYLRDKGKKHPSSAGVQEGYGINFIVANRELSNVAGQNGILFDKQFLGYKFGGDALVFNYNNRYSFFDSKVVAELNLFSMAHGTFDIDTPWSPVEGGNPPDPGFISTNNPNNSRSGLSFLSVVGLFVRANVTDFLSTFVQLDNILEYNYKNIGKYNRDVQLTTGVYISL